MCRDCGCSLGPAAQRAPFAAAPSVPGKTETIEVITAILGENDRLAAHNREHFDQHGVLALNLMSSPGAGKTALLEATIHALDGRLKIAVIEGDLATENDADAHPRQRRAGGADHHRQRLPPRRAHGARRAARPAARRPRPPVHRERRQPGLPGELRPRPAPQRHAALGARGRRQAGQVPGDVPRGRPVADHQDRPAAVPRRVQRRTRARARCARSATAAPTIELTTAAATASPPGSPGSTARSPRSARARRAARRRGPASSPTGRSAHAADSRPPR